MREYAFTHANATGAVGFSLLTFLVNWRARRDVARLRNCDDRILHQLGIARQDVNQALGLPMTENSRLVLEQLTFARQRRLTAARARIASANPAVQLG